MAFVKGMKRPAGAGRKRGVPNKATLAFKEFWTEKLESEDYRNNLWQRITRGRAPHMEGYIAQLCIGKPTDKLEVSADNSVIEALQAARKRMQAPD